MNAISPTVTAAYTTAATSRGGVDSSVSRQWATRPNDQRFLSLDDLAAHVGDAAAESDSYEIHPDAIIVRPQDDGDILLETEVGAVTQTNWSFGQMCARIGAPAGYIAELPAKLAAANLQYGLRSRTDAVAAYIRANADGSVMRAMTGPRYGRIKDVEVVNKVQALVKGDPRWKVPGMIDWSTQAGGMVQHNPFVDVTTENTTLYASDRDVWVFMCQDANPIEVGKLDDGSPDLMFRGFIVSNSEVGAQTFSLRTMLLRGVCMNRNLWGVEDVTEVTIRHTSLAPERWEQQAIPALHAYANAGAAAVIARAKAAKATIIATTEGEGLDFLMGRKGGSFSKTMANRVLARVREEEGHDMRSVWDAAQGITALARRIQQQDQRVRLECIAGDLMSKVSA